MRQNPLTLSLRAICLAKKSPPQQPICRRCLATQAVETPLPNHHSNLASVKPASPVKIASTVPSNPQYDPALPSEQRIAPDGRTYRLTKIDFNLKKPLAHKIPVAYLQHSTSEILPEHEKTQRAETVPHKKIVGVVVRSGTMQRTVKVRITSQKWNKTIKKYFTIHTNHLVHDPNSSLNTGDVVELHRLRVTEHVRHVVASIISPFGTPIESRTTIPTADERLSEYKEKRFAKLKRRKLRRQAAQGDAAAIKNLKEMGLDPGAGTEPGVGLKGNVQKKVGKIKDGGKGAILGQKGQKLLEGDLPGGKHEVGKIGERAKFNKEKAVRLEAEAVENLVEADLKEEEVNKNPGVSSGSTVP